MLVRQTIREHAFLTLGYTLLLAINFATAIIFWPDLRANLNEFAIFAKIIPVPIVQSLVYMVEEHGYWAYFGLHQLFKGAGVIGMVTGALLGSLMVAREVDNRTAEFLFSRPVSRVRLFMVRWATGLLLVIGPFVITTLGAWISSSLVDESIPFQHVAIGVAYLSLYMVMIFTVSLSLSTFADHQLKPALIVIGFMLIHLAIYMVKTVWVYSAYRLIDLDRIIPIAEGIYPVWPAVSFALITVVAMVLGIRQISRRDF